MTPRCKVLDVKPQGPHSTWRRHWAIATHPLPTPISRRQMIKIKNRAVLVSETTVKPLSCLCEAVRKNDCLSFRIKCKSSEVKCICMPPHHSYGLKRIKVVAHDKVTENVLENSGRKESFALRDNTLCCVSMPLGIFYTFLTTMFPGALPYVVCLPASQPFIIVKHNVCVHVCACVCCACLFACVCVGVGYSHHPRPCFSGAKFHYPILQLLVMCTLQSCSPFSHAFSK